MLPRDGEDVERREVSRLAPCVHIELRADASNEFRLAAFRGKHSAQKKQIARLHRFDIGAERLRWRWELNATLIQPLLSAGRPRVDYHLLSQICFHLLSLIGFASMLWCRPSCVVFGRARPGRP